VRVTLDKRVDDFVATKRQLFIDGEWVDAAAGRTFETPNPAHRGDLGDGG
jgi:phenylacetaldehyde dehydrogenase